MAMRPSQEKLIRCAQCGEDYSPTYRKCPFCGARNDPRVSQAPRASRPAPSEDDPEQTRVVSRVEEIGDDASSEKSYRPVRREPVRSAPQRPSRQEDDDDGYVFDGQDLFDEDDGFDDDYRPAKGGKRLAGGSGAGRNGRSAPAPVEINWPRVITFLCSLIIIIAAMVILFTIIYPQLHKSPNPQTSAPTGSQQVEPSGQVQPSGQVEPSEQIQPSEQVEPSGGIEPSGAPAELFNISVEGNGRIDLAAGGTYQFEPVFEPADWSGEVTYTSSDERYAAVDQNGLVTNLNTEAGTTRSVTITISAGGIDLDCTVNCAGPGGAAPTTQPTTAPSGEIPAGTRGVITGASGGLRVRSGPGTSYDPVASLRDGDAVTVVSYAGDGWYEITYAGSGGAASPGYIMGEYISVS